MNRKTRQILRATERFEALLAENFDADGGDLAEKTCAASEKLPRGIVEKLQFLARLQAQARRGDDVSNADFHQAKYWITAATPYLDYGAARKSCWSRRVFWTLALAAAAFCVYYYWTTLR